MKLSTYDDWKQCITIACGIPLTAEYIQMRIKDLNDSRDFGTKNFRETWGDKHLETVISWFEKSQSEMSN